jgi:hypothetical protein
MSYTRRTRRNEYYLDVSDFVLSEPRDVMGANSPKITPIQVALQFHAEVMHNLEDHSLGLFPPPH